MGSGGVEALVPGTASSTISVLFLYSGGYELIPKSIIRHEYEMRNSLDRALSGGFFSRQIKFHDSVAMFMPKSMINLTD